MTRVPAPIAATARQLKPPPPPPSPSHKKKLQPRPGVAFFCPPLSLSVHRSDLIGFCFVPASEFVSARVHDMKSKTAVGWVLLICLARGRVEASTYETADSIIVEGTYSSLSNHFPSSTPTIQGCPPPSRSHPIALSNSSVPPSPTQDKNQYVLAGSVSFAFLFDFVC